MLHKFECRQRTNEIQRCACEVHRPVAIHTINTKEVQVPIPGGRLV